MAFLNLYLADRDTCCHAVITVAHDRKRIYLIIKFGAAKNCKLHRKIRIGLKVGICSLDFIVLVEPTMETKEPGGLEKKTLLLFLKQKSVKTQDKCWKSTQGGSSFRAKKQELGK